MHGATIKIVGVDVFSHWTGYVNATIQSVAVLEYMYGHSSCEEN